MNSGGDPEFLERGFICIKVCVCVGGGGSHLFYTSIHFVKYAHVVKLYVTYVRILHIDKIPPKSATFCIRFQFFTCMGLFYNWRGSNMLQVKVHNTSLPFNSM